MNDYDMNIYNSEEFYEKQEKLDECHCLLESAIDCLKTFDEFKDETDYIKIALIEVKKKEEEIYYGFTNISFR